MFPVDSNGKQELFPTVWQQMTVLEGSQLSVRSTEVTNVNWDSVQTHQGDGKTYSVMISYGPGNIGAPIPGDRILTVDDLDFEEVRISF